MGTLIINDTNTERFFEPTQIMASIVKEATGTDFITEMSGAKSLRINFTFPAAKARTQPLESPSAKPSSILPIENTILLQNVFS